MGSNFAFDPVDPNRRVFIRGVGAVGMGLLSAALLGGCESLFKQIANRPMRRRLRPGSAEVDADIATYRLAVGLMKALPPFDRRSWWAQAAIHGSGAGGFNLCQHGTDHFFSWHRAYLACFENICQKLTGNNRFALPYWNWNQNPEMHAAFLASGDLLFHRRVRTSVADVGAVSSAALDAIFADTNFFTFSGTLESTPHNTVHSVVGADMGSGGSAIDPIFWNHHCMVDYCWAKWNIELGNDNTNQSAWINTSWNHFFDGTGNPVSITAGLTTLLPLLTYQYEPSTIGSNQAGVMLQASADFSALRARVEKGADVSFNVKRRYLLASGADITVGRPFSTPNKIPAAELRSLITDPDAPEQFFVRIESVDYPKVNDFFIRVFINLPAASADTPTTDPHYAGSFAIFGTAVEGRPPHHAPSYLVNATKSVRELIERRELSGDGQLTVQLVTVPAHTGFSNAGAVIRLQTVELLVTPVRVSR